MNRNWTRSIQSNWIINQIITIRLLDYSNLVPLNFKIINQNYKTSKLKLKLIYIHNSCCWFWKIWEQGKTFHIHHFTILTSVGGEQVPSYLVSFFWPAILRFILRLAKPRPSLDF